MKRKYQFKKLDAQTLTPAQFAQIVEIEANCGLDPYPAELLMKCIAEMDTFACLDGEQIVGFLTMHSSSYFGGSLYIVNINVAKAYRRQGIAKGLLYAGYAYYLPTHAGKLVSLDVMKDSKAVGLYQKAGFQITDVPSRNGDTDVVMAVPLTALGPNLQKALGES